MGKVKLSSFVAAGSASFDSPDAAEYPSGVFQGNTAKVVRCPFLNNSKKCCTIDAKAYVLNHFKLHRYCNKPDYKRCRLYIDLSVWPFLNSEPF